MCLLGGMAAGGLVFAQWWLCPGYGCADDATCVCCVVAKNPPWTLLAGLATLPAVALGWFWRTDERNQEFQNAEETGRADRFVRYAQMLGADNVSALGGIHGLTHLAMEDSKRRDLVRDTLCSFIRSKVTRDHEHEAHEYPDPDRDAFPLPPALTISTSLEAISALRITGAGLREIDLDNLNAQSIVLVRADLRECRLRSAVLRGANLSGSDLTQANCRVVNLTGADLSGCRLLEADFGFAILSGANLRNADLRGANLGSAKLSGANFEGANLDNAKLDDALISGALLSAEQLESTEGEAADLAVFHPVKFE
jgi:uncharacterized protein YjbI with pentapeptide repeats